MANKVQMEAQAVRDISASPEGDTLTVCLDIPNMRYIDAPNNPSGFSVEFDVPCVLLDRKVLAAALGIDPRSKNYVDQAVVDQAFDLARAASIARYINEYVRK